MNATTEVSHVLSARGLRRDYGRQAGLVHAVDGVDLDIARGETVAIMGPSGCGKSSLLYLLGGLDRPSAGQIWLDGVDMTRLTEWRLARVRREAIGFVFQAFHLMDELSAVENVELPARWSPTRRWCWPTSPPATWTAPPPRTCWGCSTACTPPGRR